MATLPLRSRNIAELPSRVFILKTPLTSKAGRIIALRPSTQEDEDFLRRVYVGTRADELALVDWSDEQKGSFANMQFNAQHSYYQSIYPDADYLIILENDEPVGRLYIHEHGDEIRIIDIAVLPEHRNNGTGTALLDEILAEGRQKGKAVSIYVEKFNRALRLYLRLGFVAVEDQGVYVLMKRFPGKQ
ncbi:MAG TPA: GNAT family N-acetyltransferase [Dissulfurispiraceae bacterium]|nr:GNAT family N-acetyltransferase [Dissulfurispiraceae bacterium]